MEMASCAVLSHPLSIINRGRIGISMTKVVKFININKLLTLYLSLFIFSDKNDKGIDKNGLTFTLLGYISKGRSAA